MSLLLRSLKVPQIKRFNLFRKIIQKRNFSSDDFIRNSEKKIGILTIAIFSGVVIFDFANENRLSIEFYRNFVDGVAVPMIRFLDAETAHSLSLKAASLGLGPKDHSVPSPILSTKLFGLNFDNCIGLAAGYDKNAEAIDGLFDMGFGFVEIGTVTPEPQSGNEKPRIFRLVEDKGIINRCGFNNHGTKEVVERLKKWSDDKKVNDNRLLGVNVGKNKWVSESDAADDYCKAIKALGPFGDYIVVNISSPNTPGLRLLQKREAMSSLLKKAKEARDVVRSSLKVPKPLPLLVKIAPDLSTEERKEVAIVAMESEVDGIIVCNTTIERPKKLKSVNKIESGGLSGAPLKQAATQAVFDMYAFTKGKIPIVGVGGIGTGQDAYEKIRAGASAVQIYSMLVYNGPGSIQDIKRNLEELLKNDGFANVSQAVGADHKK